VSFKEQPQPDACRAWMPLPDPPVPGPPSPPLVCHMPKGHEDPRHAPIRNPGPLTRRWDGDGRPVTAPLPPSGDSTPRPELCSLGCPCRERPAVLPPGTVEPDQQADQSRALVLALVERYRFDQGFSHEQAAWYAEQVVAALAARPVPVDGEQRERVARWEFARHAPVRYWGTGTLPDAEAAAYEAADELLALLGAQPDQLPTCSDAHQYDADGLVVTLYCEQAPGHDGQHNNHEVTW
jgi:hypothetical protein